MTATSVEASSYRVASRHVLTDGYLTIYTDGSYVLCQWQVAP